MTRTFADFLRYWGSLEGEELRNVVMFRLKKYASIFNQDGKEDIALQMKYVEEACKEHDLMAITTMNGYSSAMFQVRLQVLFDEHRYVFTNPACGITYVAVQVVAATKTGVKDKDGFDIYKGLTVSGDDEPFIIKHTPGSHKTFPMVDILPPNGVV